MFLNVLKNIITNKRRILLTQELFVEAPPFFRLPHTSIYIYKVGSNSIRQSLYQKPWRQTGETWIWYTARHDLVRKEHQRIGTSRDHLLLPKKRFVNQTPRHLSASQIDASWLVVGKSVWRTEVPTKNWRTNEQGRAFFQGLSYRPQKIWRYTNCFLQT